MFKKKKPIKEISGNDPRLAQALKSQMDQLSGIDTPPIKAFDTQRSAWMNDQIGKAKAHAEHFFMTDDDMPLSRHILMISIVLFFFIAIAWANYAVLEEVTRGDGTVIPSSEIQKISSLEGGILEEMLVKEGDEVEVGQTLARLRDVAAASEYGSSEARYLGTLATVTRLQAEAEGKVPQFPENVMKGAPQSVAEEMNTFRANQDRINTQTMIFQQQKSQRSQELNELQIKQNDLRGQLSLAEEEKAMVAPLVASGSAPRMELLQLDRQIKERQTELNSVTAAIPRARSAISEADARIRDINSTAKATAQTELSAKLTEMNAIRESLTGLADRRERTEIKSPVNGYIKEVAVYTQGGVVQPGQTFIEIVPKDDQLLVQARISPKDIAFLYPDQDAVVKITAYDFSVYGGLKGKVVSISPDAVTDEEGNSYYLVRIRTEDNTLKRRDEVLPIIPGMVASVDILTGEKTVMEYLMKPFIKTLDGAMRER